MGQEVVKALCREPETQLVGAVELQVAEDYLALPDGSGAVPFSSSLVSILTSCHPEVLVDFTIAQATMPSVRVATKQGVNLVIGTTGLTSDDLGEIDRLATAHKVGVVVAPNFALGAVLMIHLAKIAARYLDYAEIIELHHDQKADAPSGTAIKTAELILADRKNVKRKAVKSIEKVKHARGGKMGDVHIHSVRLQGLVAHQEVIFGGLGQTLKIRHDSISRESFMPGVVMAIRKVGKLKGLVYGLENLL